MYTPHTYPVALLMMLVSMLCWGSWANTQKIDKAWRFQLFYWDYMWGILVCALLFGVTLGRTDTSTPENFFHNLGSASTRSLVEAFGGGMIFNLGNLLLVAAISVAGMAVAFPLGAGLALVIGAVLNYIVSPAGNPLLLFGGILLICAAIAANAMAYRGLSKGAKAGAKGIVLSVLCGVVIWAFLPLCREGLDRRESSRAVHRVLRICAWRSRVQLSPELCVHAMATERIAAFDQGLLPGRTRSACLGSLGGLIWGIGTICGFVAAYTPLVGPTTSLSLGEGNTMISAIWGVFVWKEFRGASSEVRRLFALMFTLFVLGLVSISLAPVFR